MPGKTCHVALMDTKFMGRVHSNAYLKVGKFFDLPLKPVMHTVTAQRRRHSCVCRALGLAKRQHRLESGGL